MRVRIWSLGIVVAVAAIASGGCGGKEAAPPATLGAAAVTVLVRADGQDGQVDKVVANCASCQLHMPGKAEHAVHAGDYEMRFCSENCKENFSKDLQASIQGLEISEELN